MKISCGSDERLWNTCFHMGESRESTATLRRSTGSGEARRSRASTPSKPATVAEESSVESSDPAANDAAGDEAHEAPPSSSEGSAERRAEKSGDDMRRRPRSSKNVRRAATSSAGTPVDWTMSSTAFSSASSAM